MAYLRDNLVKKNDPLFLIAKVRVSVPISSQNFQNGKSEFDYLVSKGTQIQIGNIVEVSFRNRTIWGVVYSLEYETRIKHSKLKQILSISSLSPIKLCNLKFLEKVSEWTMAPFGQVLRALLSVPNAYKDETPIFYYSLSLAAQFEMEKLSKARKKVINWCMQKPPVSINTLCKEIGVSRNTINSMFQEGQLERVQNSLKPKEDTQTILKHLKTAIGAASKLNLSTEQQQAADQIIVHENKFNIVLLDGVTGSGKTEVYFELVKRQILSGNQCLILLPEIALTAGWVDRFNKWFGFTPYIWHSGITASKKKIIWRDINEGYPGVVVGARSALFLPFSSLSVIVVDEEHDVGYKQEEQVIYNARDMAILRAKLAECNIILASATPSLESWTNMLSGRYQHITLTNRYGLATMPDIQTIDLTKNKPLFGKWISEPLISNIKEKLNSKQQVLLYLNRRGYAPISVCNGCGMKQSCHQCDSLLVTHRLSNLLRCHQCGVARPFENKCQSCGQTDTIQLVGPGVERLAEEVYELFPDARVTILSSDTLSNPKQIEPTIQSIEKGEVDIIIGTQMVSKGHHFPKLTCVAVIDGDFGLSGGDLRAGERTFQMLTQVAGRSGRENQRGTVFIQTSEPFHPVLQALKTQKRDNYFKLELEMRDSANMPPYRRLAAIIYSSIDETAITTYVKKLANLKPQFEDVYIHGPAPAPIYKIKGRHRFRFLVNAPKKVNMQKIIHGWHSSLVMPAIIRRQIDIDPYNFM